MSMQSHIGGPSGTRLFACIALLLTCVHFQAFARTDIPPDSVTAYFANQLASYPQEKLYVQTDKPDYIAGEDVWFRIYLVDNVSHTPDSTSRYVYGELINPHDSIVSRVKIRPTHGAYHGHFKLDQRLPEGDYMLRFYTRFMEGTGEEYFYRKRISVGDPLTGTYRTEAEFDFSDNGSRVDVTLKFIDNRSQTPITPTELRMRNRGRDLKKVFFNPKKDIRLSLNPARDLVNNTLYIEYDYDGKFHKQFIALPPVPHDFSVSFFPEGGYLPQGTTARMAFKALGSNGLGFRATGRVIDHHGNEVLTFHSNKMGMGSFALNAQPGTTYKAVVQNELGIEKEFPLPAASPNAIVLQTSLSKDILNVGVRAAAGMSLPTGMRLVVHCRGMLIYNKPWDASTPLLRFHTRVFPGGVLHLLLTDAHYTPISERLVFNTNADATQARLALQTNCENYASRQRIDTRLQLTDAAGNPLQGSFSVAVTDDKDLTPETNNTILTTLLLTSELRGFIETPGYYFENTDRTTLANLDILMMTQGWRRYDIPAVLRGRIEPIKGSLELGPEISGSVYEGQLKNKKAKGVPVSILSTNHPFVSAMLTDAHGNFCFQGIELPDSTRYVLQSRPLNKRDGRNKITVNQETYPPLGLRLPLTYTPPRTHFEAFINKADKKYIYEHGMREIYLDEVVITAKRFTPPASPYSSPENTVLGETDIERFKAHTLKDILMRLPRVYISGGEISLNMKTMIGDTGGENQPFILLDGSPVTDHDFLLDFPAEAVLSVELVNGAALSLFGSNGANGVLIIQTKSGGAYYKKELEINIATITPLGFQAPKEFYSPTYATPNDVQAVYADLRTTIYWNPDVRTAPNGDAQLSFYAADAPTTYSVVIEGVTNDGKLIYKRHKISRMEQEKPAAP